MLLPNQLKKGTMNFIEVEDLKRPPTVEHPKTQLQKDRENYEEALMNDKEEQDVSEEQREKTIKCLFKILDYQLQNAKD